MTSPVDDVTHLRENEAHELVGGCGVDEVIVVSTTSGTHLLLAVVAVVFQALANVNHHATCRIKTYV